MRYVPINRLRKGMLCGRRLQGNNDTLLLNRGAIIQDSYIKKIKSLGFSGIYIDDNLSTDIEVSEIIPDNLRHKSVKTLKDLFNNIGKPTNILTSKLDTFSSLINDMLENIMSNKNIMINMQDLKIFDDYTYFHSVNVGVLSMLVGVSMKLNRKQLHQLGLASMLHDIGKVFIPLDILNKPGKLTDDEFIIMKSHSIKGFEHFNSKNIIPAAANLGILDHHERYDGTGYPYQKENDETSLYGKIIAIADVFDALTSDRPYRKALSPSDATEYIMGGCNSQFNDDIVKLFLQRIAPYAQGTTIVLSNGWIGIVALNYFDSGLRPLIKVISKGHEEITPFYLDLRSDRNSFDITITGLAY